jgi:hypothetical protein
MVTEILAYITVDGHAVNQFDRVYEIRYAWVNWELSLAHPAPVRIDRLPAGTLVWYDQDICERVCYQINHPPKEVWFGY